MDTGVRFAQTTKGFLGYVKQSGNQEKIVWFIREELDFNKEKTGLFGVYRSDDGGCGFILIPRLTVNSDSECFFDTLRAAKQFIYGKY